MLPVLRNKLIESFQSNPNNLNSIIDDTFSEFRTAYQTLCSERRRISHLEEEGITPEEDITGNE